MTVLPATLHLKVAPHQVLHFASARHQADEHGLIMGVPYDTARVLIDDKQHPAREATAEEVAAVASEAADMELTLNIKVTDLDELTAIKALAAQAEAIFASLSEKFDGAEIVDSGETREHQDMIFIVVKDGVEITSGTVSELFEHAYPPSAVEPPSSAGIELAGPAATAPATNASFEVVNEAPDAAAPHDGEPLPETAAE